MNQHVLKVIYEEIKDEYGDLDYLSEKARKSKTTIFHIIQLLYVMGFLEKTQSVENCMCNLYKVKKEVNNTSFEIFRNRVLEKLR